MSIELATQRIELPTAFPYATLRNWRETPQGEEIFAPTPCFFHMDYRGLVKQVMWHIDAQGRIHMLDKKTDDGEYVSFLELPILSMPQEPEKVDALVETLVQDLCVQAERMVAYHFDIRTASDEEIDRRDFIEGQIAYIIGPYRYEPELLQQVIERTKQKQYTDELSIR